MEYDLKISLWELKENYAFNKFIQKNDFQILKWCFTAIILWKKLKKLSTKRTKNSNIWRDINEYIVNFWLFCL